jgi:predicted AlkP superfamily phosphohydrolase/phosphomutase
LVIFSDHGFCKVKNVLFINEWLLQKKYTSLNASLVSRLLMWLGFDWESLAQPGFTTKVFRFTLNHFPQLAEKMENSLRSGMVVDGNQQLKQSKVTSFSINEPLAWLRISQNSAISQEDLVSELEELKKQGVLKNVFETDKIYTGKFIRYAPGKILVEAPDGCAIDTLRWNRRKLLGKPLYTKKGVHQREGILLVYGSRLNMESPTVRDIVPTVLGMLKLPVPENADGNSLLVNHEQVKVLNVAKSLQT